jgi:hypothetical protein
VGDEVQRFKIRYGMLQLESVLITNPELLIYLARLDSLVLHIGGSVFLICFNILFV